MAQPTDPKRQRRAAELSDPADAHDPPAPALCATLRGEFVHATALRCAEVLGKGLGVVAGHDIAPGELLLRARGLRFSAAASDEHEDGEGGGAAFLAEALSQLCELRAGSAADLADADALIRGWRGLCPRPVPPDARAPLDAQAELLGEMLAHFEGCGVADVNELIELVVKVECNAFEGGLFPLAAMFNHSCAANCSVALRQIQLPQAPGGADDSAINGGEYGNGGMAAAWVYEVRSMAEITAGDELCLSYLGLAEQPLAGFGRRARLAGWGFECACVRCAAVGKSPMGRREAELSAVRCANCARSQNSSGSRGSDACGDVWSGGWCLQASTSHIGPCLACQWTPPQELADRLAEHAQLLRDQARPTDTCMNTESLAAAVAALKERGPLEVHPGHWLRYLAADAFAGSLSLSLARALSVSVSVSLPPSLPPSLSLSLSLTVCLSFSQSGPKLWR